MSTTRVRRTPREAQALILEAAERLLVEGGPPAVQVRAVAQRVGMTDAGVTHHFRSREGLLIALLRHGGRRLRKAVEGVTGTWVDERASVAELVDGIADVYEEGYGELAIALHAAGWRDEGSGMLDPVVEVLHQARNRTEGQQPRRAETRLAVAALHQALATEPSYGSSFRRSAGMSEVAADRSRQQRQWWVNTLIKTLDIT
ncbi:TetR/AcrR family transcriptional regulator [Luteipulveratus mongoliensis]|uniref:TetR family transcriptional regulator n=1 Tax=Luteipulveratus mongoliensis TaxID=571913 RepID=A0A0K1JN61_9MICO|nr:helix-turn-helix domain-containing protein [Luteipulveratus mongoliensis]AKU18157.1 TetR family transcriptional regulator [Luteipulveratus mongoliensis]